jgi:uncharacterized protein (TIGR02246 family)
MSLPVEDILAIHDLVARYCHACDSGDGDAYADVFTEDGVMSAPPILEAKGREELAQLAIGTAQNNMAPRHLVSSLLIEGDGDRATLRAYCEFVAMVGEPPSHGVQSSGIYNDDLVKVGGQWKFAQRHFVLDSF